MPVVTLDFILTFHKVFDNFSLQKETYFTTKLEEQNFKEEACKSQILCTQ